MTKRRAPKRAIDANTRHSEIAALLSDPSNVENVARAQWLLGCEAERRSDWQDAVDNYQRAVALRPADGVVRYWGHNNLAYSLVLLGRFDEARLHGLTAIKVNEDRHNAHKNLGLAYAGLGRFLEAAACFIDAACRCPADERAWLHLQELLRKSPCLLDHEAELAESVRELRQLYKANGGVPALH